MSNRLRPRLRACPECAQWIDVALFEPDVDVCSGCLGGER